MSNPDLQRERWAALEANEKIISVEASSGVETLQVYDDEGDSSLLKADAGTIEIGDAVRRALASSRLLSGTYAEKYLDFREGAKRHETRIDRLMAFQGCKTKSTMMKNMMYVSIIQKEGQIFFSSTIYDRRGGWEGDNLPSLTITDTASDEEIGTAALQALARCR